MPATVRRGFASRLFDRLFDLRATPPRVGRVLERLEARDVPAVVPFGLPQSVLSGVGYPYTAAAADLNGDTRPDVLAAATDGSAVVWAANLGDGVFGPKRTIDPGTPSGFVANTYAVDFDGDGSLDVLTAGDDILRVYLNDGTGTFAAPIEVATSGTFRAAFAADLDGDGFTDVATITNTAVGSSSGGTAEWYRNDGTNTFTLAQTISAAFDGPRAATGLDADGDGDFDFVVGANRVNEVVLFRNDGTGVFGAGETITADIAGVRNVYAADLNADGHTDLVSVAYGSSEVAWYANDGTGAFTKSVISNVSAGFFAAAVGDIDGNGTPDVVAAAFDDSSVSWFANNGAGNFGPRQVISAVPGGGGLLAVGVGDFTGDGRPDVVSGDTTDPYRVAVYENRFGRFSTVVIPPATGTALIGQAIDVKVHFGVPVAVTGAPEIDLDIGGVTRTAAYVAGSGTPVLTFRYVVTAADVDLDGVELTAAAVRLAGGTMADPAGDPVNLNLPAADLSRLRVNGSAPLVSTITRLGATPTNAREVRFTVTFSEPVTGVTAADFAPLGPLTSAAVTGVTGSGATYTVTLTTGTGSGSLGLSVVNSGSVADAAGNALGIGFAGGEVYTLNRRPARSIDTFFTEDHGDIGIGFEDGALHPHVHTDDLGEREADEVLIVAGPDALRTTPTGPQWAFLGAGPQSYLLPEAENPALPYLGIGAEEIPAGTVASYFNADPRVNATGAWVQVRVVGYRGPAGAHASIYNSGSPDPTVWAATSDGLTADDAVFVPAGSHGHFNFAFTAAGNYELDVVASAFLDANGNGTYDPGIDPYTESGVTTYYFQIDPPGGPTAVSLPADPLPVDPVPPKPAPVARPVAAANPTDGTVRLTHADGRTSTVTPFPGFVGSVRTAAADLNGDGVADLVAAVGGGAAPHVKVIDGKTGAELMSFFAYGTAFTGGVSVAAGDITGDGVADIITAAGAGAGPHVKVFDGRTGAEVRSFFAYAPGFTGGVSVAAADLDGDGVADIVTGTLSGAPHVKAFDGATGAERLSFFAYDFAFTGGVFVAAGDLDGDGKAELVTGTGTGGGSHVKLFDGRTAAERGGFIAYAEAFRGGVRVAVADTDGDGKAEVVTGAGPGGAPHVKVFDGRTLAQVDEFMAGDDGVMAGVFVG